MTQIFPFLTCLILSATFVISPKARIQENPFKKVKTALDKGVHQNLGCEECHRASQTYKIHRVNIPQMCGDCHPIPLEDYLSSVHWDQGKTPIVCIDCHGIHDITFVNRPDSRAYRSLVCKTCHIGPGENFNRSPHNSGLERIGALACASCHNNHKIQHPTIALVEPACAKCHPHDSSAFQMGQEIKIYFSDFRNILAQAKAKISKAESQGINANRHKESLKEAQMEFTQARLLWHSLKQNEIKTAAQKSIQIAQTELLAVSNQLHSYWFRRIVLGIVWIIILLNISLLYVRYQRLKPKISQKENHR